MIALLARERAGPTTPSRGRPEETRAPIPDEVASEDAAFVTVGAIALHGVRVAATPRRSCVVIGLGLVGQLTLHC